MRLKIIGLVAIMMMLVPLACDLQTKPIKTITLTPSTGQTVPKGDNDAEDFACGVDPCLQSHGTSCEVAFTELRVGYSYSYDDGTDPCPCWFWVDCVWRSAVIFDLTPLQGKGIVSATLSYGQTNQKQQGSVATNAESCVNQLIIANGPPTNLATSGDAIVGTIASPMNISATVRDWVDGTTPNNGLIFIGFDESLPAEENRECYSKLSNMQLEVQFTD